MNRLLIGWVAAVVAAVPLCAQSMADMDVQVHGYAAQGFLYTTHNNIFYADSSDGSPAWTEAVVNVTAQPNDKLRVGVQARYQLLGDSGNAITMDWAAADYRVNDYLGVRFGKVKTPSGLFNETQDLDPTYMWALLPQSVYDITTRNADLAHYGGVVYGSWNLGEAAGKVEYRFWGGESVIPTNDGQFSDLNAAGNGPTNAFVYPQFGGALHTVRTEPTALGLSTIAFQSNTFDPITPAGSSGAALKSAGLTGAGSASASASPATAVAASAANSSLRFISFFLFPLRISVARRRPRRCTSRSYRAPPQTRQSGRCRQPKGVSHPSGAFVLAARVGMNPANLLGCPILASLGWE